MLGNDIVDLQLAAKQGNWRRKGYLQKIFTSQEQDLISNATDQNQIVWLLWSMKEAAYKIVTIEIGERFYSPRSFECFVDLSNSLGKGKVVYDKVCIACHQATGQGIPGAFPPLAKSDYLNKDVNRAIKGVVKGLTGPITVNGKKFNSDKIKLNSSAISLFSMKYKSIYIS